MKKSISQLIIIPVLFTGITVSAQEISPDMYRTATPKEILLHDRAYNVLQQEIETNICDNNWGISKMPSLLSNNRDEKMVIINYLKGVGDIPVFMREGERFEIELKPESPLYKSNQDEIKKQTDEYVARSANISSADKKELAVIKIKNEQYEKNLARLSDDNHFGSIALELNQSNTIVHKIGDATNKRITVPGISQVSLFVQLPDESNADTVYNAIVYIGSWPKLSGTKMLPFHFIKNNSSEPVIENMIIEISAFTYNKMMKMIHSIDWTKLEALIKNNNEK